MKRIVFILIFPIILTNCTSMKDLVKQNPDKYIHGYVSTGFEEVKEEFARNFTERDEIGAACAVYYKGEKVVDLWGGVKDRKTKELWEENTVVQVFSTTKGMALLVLAKLHSDGLLDYSKRVSTYWPEFAQHGKQNITVEQLITHKAGLVLLERPIKVSELDNYTLLSELLEDAEPMWEPGKKHGYHSATIGLYIQQLVRRIDPKGRTIGQYFQEEIAGPLNIEFWIGIPDDFEKRRLAELKMISPIAGIFNLGKPPKGLAKKLINPWSLMNKSFSSIKNDTENSFEEMKYENPAGGGVGTARALAKVYGALASGGEELNISPETISFISKFTDEPADGIKDEVMGWESLGSSGGYAKPDQLFDFGSESAFGFTGSGGSFAFADPMHKCGYAYVMNKMDFYGMNDPREVALREAMYKCILKIENEKLKRLEIEEIGKIEN